MPYDPANDQYFLGYSPEKDGSDFDPNKKSPKLSDAFRWISRHATTNSTIQVVVVGKMRNSDPTKGVITGVQGNVSFGKLEATSTGIGLTGKAVARGGGGFSTETKIQQLLGLREKPEKVTGMYFRILD